MTERAPEELAQHPAAWSDERLLRQCRIDFVRRSGPGGQHRNKVESGVQLTFGPAGIVAEANERRSQAENRRVALRRLRLRLAVAIRVPCDPAQPPPELWVKRIQRGRIVVNPEHEEFPALLAIALDRLAALGWDSRAAAGSLSCTTTQLVRFVAEFPEALAELNRQRLAIGLRPLRRA
ncbi:MAG: peptide chain release factor-like protein [Planctomycetaceae bacterium]|nr:peptide chain release factor-like protein [Planctomycetaceae bacterium]